MSLQIFRRCLIVIALAQLLIAYEFPQQRKTQEQQAETEKQVNSLTQLSSAVSEVVREAERAVVFITVTRVVQVVPRMPDLFEHFFGGPRRHPKDGEERRQRVAASGFFVDLENGYIITNAHVVKGSEHILLTLANGAEYEGVVTGADENTDIAVLQVADKNFERDGLDWLELNASTEVQSGEFVIALGAPFGFKASVSFGIVSGLQRGNLGTLTALGNFIQTDAAINPGNSGGPLLNAHGQVIGVNSAIYSVSGGYNGLGFAVPAEIARKVALQLIETGVFARGYLGIEMQELEPGQRDHFKVDPGEQGVLITQTFEDSPAAKAGLKPSDVILAIDGQEVSAPFELALAVGFNPPGTVIEVSYLRDGKRMKVKVELGEMPSQMTPGQSKKSLQIWGLQLEQLDAAAVDMRGILVLSSDNIKSDVSRGDIIVAVDNIEVQGLEWFEDYLKDKDEVVLYVRRGGHYLFITLPRK